MHKILKSTKDSISVYFQIKIYYTSDIKVFSFAEILLRSLPVPHNQQRPDGDLSGSEKFKRQIYIGELRG